MSSRILVVEDERDILDLISYNLEKEGFDVSTCQNGEKALQLIEKDKFDLILLDLMLPGMQGMELSRILKSSDETSFLPLIMVTAKSE